MNYAEPYIEQALMNIPTKDSSLKKFSYSEMASYEQLENTESGIVQELERAEKLLLSD